MFWLDKVVLDCFNNLFSNTNVFGYEVGKFAFISILGMVAAELYNIKNKHKRGVR
ncbi:hypothetical protein [Clostridium sp. Marseille-QA1073]